jgi:hypothetical protein
MSSTSCGIPAPRTLSGSPKETAKEAPTVVPRRIGAWKLTQNQLIPFPESYPLERSHVYIKGLEVQAVVTSISECLRQESIAAVYENNKVRLIPRESILMTEGFTHIDLHQALAHAETPEHVRLCIRLFLDEEQVVVEVQRRSGCCFLFHQAAKSILCAAKGMKPQRLPTFKIPECVKAKVNFSFEDSTEEAVQIASGLLKKDRYDAHLLGMESLVQLTKGATSTKAAHALFHGQVLDNILSLIQSWRMHHEDMDVCVVSDTEKDYFAMMHRYALTVLANCLNALEQASELEQLLGTQYRLVADELLSVLIDELKNAEQRPHDAWQACRCLKTLLRSSKDTKMRAVGLGAPKAATSALNEGACTHLHLEEECRKLQVELGR